VGRPLAREDMNILHAIDQFGLAARSHPKGRCRYGVGESHLVESRHGPEAKR
jgi:hypothetical protein